MNGICRVLSRAANDRASLRLQEVGAASLRRQTISGEGRLRLDQPRASVLEALNRDGFGELGAETIAGGPLDDGVGALTARKHQPDAGADLEIGLGLGH